MSAEPLSREERMKGEMHHSLWVHRYEATVQDVEAKLADCERRERAAVERAEALLHLIDYAVLLHENGEAPPGHELATWDGWYRTVRERFAADDEARAT